MDHSSNINDGSVLHHPEQIHLTIDTSQDETESNIDTSQYETQSSNTTKQSKYFKVGRKTLGHGKC